jgi:hypothetical protein
MRRCCFRRPSGNVGDALHNFADGAVIAAAFLNSLVPQQVGDFASLFASGHGRGRALLLASRPGPTFLRSSAICRKLPGSGTCAPSSAASSVADDDQGEPQ